MNIVIIVIMLVITIGSVFAEGWDYQEEYDSSVITGSWWWIVAPTQTNLINDSDWTTRDACWPGSNNCYYEITYNKPNDVGDETKWQVKTQNSYDNYTIPISCWNYSSNEIIFRLHSDYYAPYSSVGWCYNGTWVELFSDVTQYIYEEAIWWYNTSGIRGNVTFIPIITNITKDEGENISFDMNITQPKYSDEINIFRWLLNGVTKSFSKAWEWVIGQQDAGNHTIIGIANDSYGKIRKQVYNIEVIAVNVAPPIPTGLSPTRGEYDISVVVSCDKVSDPDGDVLTYEIQADDGSGWVTITNNSYGVAVLDLTEYNYNTTIDLRCRVTDGEFVSNWINPTGEIRRVEKFMFFMYDHRTLPIYTENKPYQLGVYANTANDNINITAVSFDCNGDRLTDYYKEYDGEKTINEYFVCVNLPGSIAHIVSISLIRSNYSIQWQNACKTDELNCTIERIYNLKVI